MGEIGRIVEATDQLVRPVVIGPEAHISEGYARAEQDKPRRKTWLQAGRIEDIPNGFRGAQPNPPMERSVTSLHYNLSRFMGTGAVRTWD